MRRLGQAQDQEVELRILKDEVSALNHVSNHCGLNNVLFVKNQNRWKICLPKALLGTVLLQFHDNWGHLDVQKTWKLITNYFQLPGLRKVVKYYVKTCEICQRTFDIFGPLPSSTAKTKYILVVLDVFTKYIKLYHIVLQWKNQKEYWQIEEHSLPLMHF
jgi:hypothetical protein